MEILCGLSVVLLIVTVVGHGIWAFLAAIFRAVSGKSTTTIDQQTRCPSCSGKLAHDGEECPHCGWMSSAKGRSQAESLERLLKQIQKMHRIGSLDSLAFEQLYDAAQTNLQRVQNQTFEEPAQTEPAKEAASPIYPPSIFEEIEPKVAEVVERQTAPPKTFQAPPVDVVPVAEPVVPVRSWSQVLDAFIEERNLRWGELIGGLLIVCGSIALVISFWSQIAERPFLKFFVFNGFTAAMFGAGVYCDRRLRLATTGRGMLSISTLLVPLNFLALASLSPESAESSLASWLGLSGEVVSAGLFAWLTWLAGRTTVPRSAIFLSIGTLGPSVAALLIRRLAHSGMELTGFYALAFVPIGFYLGSLLTSLYRDRQFEQLTDREAHSQFRLLGTATFAAILPLGLLLTRSGNLVENLRHLAPLMCLAAAPGMSVGLFVNRRSAGPDRAGMRMAASAIAFAGMLILIAGIVFAWPDPALSLLTALTAFVILSIIAFRQSLPAAHLAALPCLGFAYLIAIKIMRGDLTWGMRDTAETAKALLSAGSGTALVPLAALIGGFGAWLSRTRKQDGRFFVINAGLAAVLSLALVTCFGFGRKSDPGGASWVFGIYGTILLTTGVVISRRRDALEPISAATGDSRQESMTDENRSVKWARGAVGGGAVLLLLGLIQGIVVHHWETLFAWRPWMIALAAEATILTAAAAFARSPAEKCAKSTSPLGKQSSSAKSVFQSLSEFGLTASIAAACTPFTKLPIGPMREIAPLWLWLTAIWCAAALLSRSKSIFALFQAGLTLTAIFGVSGWIETQPWGMTTSGVWLNPWSWQAYGVVIALFSTAWTIARAKLHQRSISPTESPSEAIIDQPMPTIDEPQTLTGGLTSRLRELLPATGFRCDRAMGWVAISALLAMSIYAAVPGVAQELAPRSLADSMSTGSTTSLSLSGRPLPDAIYFELAGAPHQNALGWGAWIWGAILTALVFAWRREREQISNRAALILILSTACPLLAGRWETDVATASALRWLSSFFLVGCSAGQWIIERRRESQPETVHAISATNIDRSGRLIALVLLVSAAPLFAMGLFVGIAAIAKYEVEQAMVTMLGALFVLAAIAAPIGLLLWKLSQRWSAAMPAETQLATFEASRRQGRGVRQASLLVWILGTGPLVAVGLFITSSALRGNPIVGPEPGTLFHRMGLAASYAVPVALCGLGLCSYAVRLRSSGFAFAAGLLFNVSATAAYLMIPSKTPLRFDGLLWIRLAQLNALVSSAFGLCWMGAARFAAHRQLRADALAAEEAHRPLLRNYGIPIPGLLVTQILVGVTLLALVMLPTVAAFFLTCHPGEGLAEIASAMGRGAWFLALAAVIVLGRMAGTRLTPGVVAAALVSLSVLLTSYSCSWDVAQETPMRIFLGALSAAPWFLLIGYAAVLGKTAASDTARAPVVRWTVILGSFSILWALRYFFERESTGPAVAAVLSQCFLTVLLAAFRKNRSYLYATGILASLAQTMWWWGGIQFISSGYDFAALAYLNIRAWLLPSAAALFMELRIFETPGCDNDINAENSGKSPIPGFHRITSVLAIISLAFLASCELAGIYSVRWEQPVGALRMQAAFCSFIMSALCLWDRRSSRTTVRFYWLGLVVAAMFLAQRGLATRMIVWNGTWILSSYVLVTALLWRARAKIFELAKVCRMPIESTDSDRVHRWLNVANGLLSIIVIVMALGIDLTFPERSLRLWSGTAALIPGFAVALLVRPALRRSDSVSSFEMPETTPSFFDAIFALFAGIAGLLIWNWAWLNPHEVDWLQRFVVLTATLALATAAVGLGPTKLLRDESVWFQAAQWLTSALCFGTLFSVFAVIVRELQLFELNGVAPMGWPAVIVMGVAIAGLCAAALAAALIPGRDPFGLSEHGRKIYVYAVEGLLAILVLHLRLTKPELFHGFFLRYWPFVVMFIAYLGVGVGEIFRRQRRFVLADPLERTGALLPVLPVLGFWAMPNAGNFSLVMLAAGGIYSALSIMRRAFGFGLLAAIAANGGLWYHLHHVGGYAFFQHPQLWMIPFAICVLGAAYLHHEQLSRQQMTTIRYISAMTIYISSTADIFLNGVAQAPWLPVVLAGVSIVGIFVGIILRVRAFLFLGAGFLVLSMFTIIWYAAVDLHHTWLIWLTVVLAGVAVLGIFAVFEKKRQEIVRVVDKIRQWSP